MTEVGRRARKLAKSRGMDTTTVYITLAVRPGDPEPHYEYVEMRVEEMAEILDWEDYLWHLAAIVHGRGEDLYEYNIYVKRRD